MDFESDSVVDNEQSSLNLFRVLGDDSRKNAAVC
jgi:hypothetical protein